MGLSTAARIRPRSDGDRQARRAAGSLLDVVAITADGLAVTDRGVLVRALATSSINPLVMDASGVEARSRDFAGLLARIPAGQSLAFHLTNRPLGAGRIVDELGRRAEAATAELEASGSRGRARALQRLAYCEADSIVDNAAALAAGTISHHVVVPWRPEPPALALALPQLRRRRVHGVDAAAHDRAACEHERYFAQISGALQAVGLEPRPLDGGEYARLLAGHFSPATDGEYLDVDELLVDDLAQLSERDKAVAAARALRGTVASAAIGPGAQLRVGRAWQMTFALCGVPEQTWLGWVMHLTQIARPFCLGVHIHATDRASERSRQRRRYRRLYGVNRGSEMRARPLDPEARERELEAEEVNARLASSAGSGIYRVGVYLTQQGDAPDELQSQVKAQIKDITAAVDARCDDSPFAQLQLWRSTVPTGVDHRGQCARYLTEHAADTVPLVGTSPGSPQSPTWIPLGYGHLGRTLEGLDPFDPAHPNHLMLVAGRSGSGKTMTTILIVSRALSKGARGVIVDRAGHYDFLCSLVDGAVAVSLGSGEQTICPWDGEPSNEKIDFLARLHELIVGTHEQTVDQHGFNALQRGAVITAIRRVYDRCWLTGEAPREQLLQEQLWAMHSDARADGDADYATILSLLAESLAPYVGAGPYAYLADRPTTVPADAPLLVFDTRSVGDSESPAALFVIAELAQRRVADERAGHLAGRGDRRPWAGRSFLVVDEAWKLLARPATGAWVNELARRSRHHALFMIAISQQLSDFKGEQGEALLSQATIRLLLAQQPDQLPYIKRALGLCEEELAAIGELQTTKRQHANAYVINGSRGRGVLTVAVSDLEYWIATSDPVSDEPLRQAALRQAGGDPWRALALLASPAFHQEQAA